MNSDTPTARKSWFKNPFLYSSSVVLPVAIYVGFVMISRYESKRDFEKRSAKAQEEKRLENDRLTVEQLGGA